MAQRLMSKLKPSFVKSVKKPGYYSDGGNLWLQVAGLRVKTSEHYVTRSWIFRYVSPVTGKVRDMGLGRHPDVQLATRSHPYKTGELIPGARDKAADARELVRRGIDPINERDRIKGAERKRQAHSKTFSECVDAYLKAHRSDWGNARHVGQ